jgi:hypothetical protein
MNGISTLASSASTRGRLHEPEADINSLLVREVVVFRPPQTRLVKGEKRARLPAIDHYLVSRYQAGEERRDLNVILWLVNYERRARCLFMGCPLA